jgi:hypothetical protein
MLNYAKKNYCVELSRIGGNCKVREGIIFTFKESEDY